MIEFIFPILEHFCPFFVQTAQMGSDGSHFAQMGSHFAQNSTPTPVLYSAVTNPFLGYVRTQHTPQPYPTTPLFLA